MVSYNIGIIPDAALYPLVAEHQRLLPGSQEKEIASFSSVLSYIVTVLPEIVNEANVLP